MQTIGKTSWHGALTVASAACCIYFFYQNCPWALYGSYDTGWIVQVGRNILANGVPQTDTFSWTNFHRPYVAYQWLFAAGAGFLAQAGTLWLVGLAACSIIGFLMFFVMPRSWLKRG